MYHYNQWMVEIRVQHPRTDQQHKTISILIIGIFESEDEFLQLNEIDTSLATTINEIIKNKKSITSQFLRKELESPPIYRNLKVN